MAETYKVGERYYVPVMVTKVEKASEGDRYPITASYLFTKKKTAFNTFANEPDLLLTADEVAGLLKTKADAMTVTADSLQEENEELRAKVDDLEAELNNARHINEYAVETAQNKEKFIGEQRELIKKYGMVIDILLDKITALKRGESNG